MTLLGAHTLGHVHIANSGFGLEYDTEDFSPCGETVEERYNCINAWTYNPHEFDNSFYTSLFLSVRKITYSSTSLLLLNM